MTKSQQVLLALLKKSLFNIDISLPSEVNWQEVYDEAVSQSVVPIAYDGTAGVNDIPREIAKKFKDYSLAVFLQNDSVLKGQQDVSKLLQQNGIAYAILKGASVARYYSKPELRTLGDVDLLVSKADFEDTKKLLVSNGYTLTREEKNHFHCNFKKQDVIFELHFEMSDFPNTSLCNELRKELDKAVSSVEKVEYMGNSFYSLDALYQACSLLLHTERHISKDGIGLRQLIDFGFFAKENYELFSDENFVTFLKKFGLNKLATICFDVFKKYFLNEDVQNSVADDLIEMSLVKGNFGFKQDDEQMLSNRVLGSRKGANRFFVIRWFRYFKYRSSITWELAKTHTWLSNLAFVYLPIRFLFRLAIGKKEKIDFNSVIDSSKSENDLYSQFGMFEKE